MTTRRFTPPDNSLRRSITEVLSGHANVFREPVYHLPNSPPPNWLQGLNPDQITQFRAVGQALADSHDHDESGMRVLANARHLDPTVQARVRMLSNYIQSGGKTAPFATSLTPQEIIAADGLDRRAAQTLIDGEHSLQVLGGLGERMGYDDPNAPPEQNLRNSIENASQTAPSSDDAPPQMDNDTAASISLRGIIGGAALFHDPDNQ